MAVKPQWSWTTSETAALDHREGTRNVIGLVERALDLVRVRLVEQRDDASAGARARRTQEGDVVALLDEGLCERADDGLDAAISRRGHRDPRRGEHRDAQGVRWSSAIDR